MQGCSGRRARAMIDPTADVSPDAVVGEGTRIWQYAQVREGARIGRNCVLGRNVYVDVDVAIGDNCKVQNGAQIFHPAVLEDGVFVGPGAMIVNDKTPRAVNPDATLKSGADWVASGARLRHGAAVGAGSVVLPGVDVGRWAMVGAGATVVADVPDHGLAVGCPARVVGYVCACGARLPDGARSGRHECTRCGHPGVDRADDGGA